MYRNLKIFFIAVLVMHATYYMLHVTAARAAGQTMSNQDYIIQTEEINPVSNGTAVQTAINKSSPNTSEGVNYKVKTGFENLATSFPFSISLSSDIVNFGDLSPTNPLVRTVDLSINSQAAYGYSVLAFENMPLTIAASAAKTIIPDTTCDNGECDAGNAAVWTNALTYGFGYRCDNLSGTDCDSSFAKDNFYKHFSNFANNDNVQSIMAGAGSNNRKVRLSYKVNISGTQTQGVYSNVITYIAVPNF